uniref:Si:dkey-19b23.8 n=1 Tax=Salarias fasciatus TaxID=181472 RepID=A0A672J0Y5_SALFA
AHCLKTAGGSRCESLLRGSEDVERMTLKNSPAAFRRRFRRDRTESLSHGDPLFKVHYLGTEKIFSLDREQAQDAISRLLDGIANGKKLSKDHALVVRPRYVEVKELSTGRQLTKTYLQDIAYCAADANRPNVFLYICKHHGQQLQCRVFWCSRAERARDMTACLAHSFQRALSDWQQDGSATLPPGDAKGKLAEESAKSSANKKSSTLPTGLGKGETSREKRFPDRCRLFCSSLFAGRKPAPCLAAPTEASREEGRPRRAGTDSPFDHVHLMTTLEGHVSDGRLRDARINQEVAQPFCLASDDDRESPDLDVRRPSARGRRHGRPVFVDFGAFWLGAAPSPAPDAVDGFLLFACHHTRGLPTC